MGAAQLLQSLDTHPHFCAVAAESPFANFREIAYDRMGQPFHLGPRVGRTILRPLVEIAFLRARLKYHLDMQKSPPKIPLPRPHPDSPDSRPKSTATFLSAIPSSSTPTPPTPNSGKSPPPTTAAPSAPPPRIRASSPHLVQQEVAPASRRLSREHIALALRLTYDPVGRPTFRRE
jgi:hypothetical protein